MKIIDAIWERRNLNCNTTEIIIAQGDSLLDIDQKLDDIKSDYVVVKVPIMRQELCQLLTKKNFVFTEVNYKLASSEMTKSITSVYSEKNTEFKIECYSEMNDTVLDVLNNIKTGKIFTTDRISLDKHFGPKVSGLRYYNWAQDLIREGSNILVTFNNGRPLSFSFIKKCDANEHEALLWGLMPEQIGKGFGYVVPYSSLEYVYKNNGKFLHTSISSNNLPIIKLLNAFAFVTEDIKYVFSKHYMY